MTARRRFPCENRSLEHATDFEQTRHPDLAATVLSLGGQAAVSEAEAGSRRADRQTWFHLGGVCEVVRCHVWLRRTKGAMTDGGSTVRRLCSALLPG